MAGFFLSSADEEDVRQCLVLYWLVIFGIGIYDLCPMTVFGITNLQNLRDQVPLCDLVLGAEFWVVWVAIHRRSMVPLQLQLSLPEPHQCPLKDTHCWHLSMSPGCFFLPSKRSIVSCSCSASQQNVTEKLGPLPPTLSFIKQLK